MPSPAVNDAGPVPSATELLVVAEGLRAWPDTSTRFMAKVDQAGPIPPHAPELGACWTWTAGRSPKGYGQFGLTSKKKVFAHRWSYEYFIGEIPPTLQIDHLCRNTSCVNPRHLETVTNAENMRRRKEANVLSDTCGKGHLFDEANTIRKSRGRRACRICQRETNRRHQARKAEAKRKQRAATMIVPPVDQAESLRAQLQDLQHRVRHILPALWIVHDDPCKPAQRVLLSEAIDELTAAVSVNGSEL
jgi:hypothetical protein